MSRKQSTQRHESDKASHAPQHDWLTPVSDTAPCGPELEYDHDFIVLFASAAPKRDVQYGAFVRAPDPLNWSELERDCQRLMMRTKDMSVAVLYTRCRTRLAGAAGLAEGTGLLAAWLNAFAAQVHPQPNIDGEREAVLEMRMNALQALTDSEGLLADVREIVLTKSTLARLQVRDVERAFAHPRPADALAPESVAQQLQDLRAQHPAVMMGFDDAIANLAAIDTWCASHLETYQPDLSQLSWLIGSLSKPTLLTTNDRVEEPSAAPVPTTNESLEDNAATLPELKNAPPARSPTQSESAPADRQAALALIRSARTWFEAHEPSSPIPVLLKRAEQFVGKRYADVVRAIPSDLLARWEEADGA
ncbi:type VI secretion system ImpA family N-terminal domain-containing protein [Trinickia sp. YCB016]